MARFTTHWVLEAWVRTACWVISLVGLLQIQPYRLIQLPTTGAAIAPPFHAGEWLLVGRTPQTSQAVLRKGTLLLYGDARQPTTWNIIQLHGAVHPGSEIRTDAWDPSTAIPSIRWQGLVLARLWPPRLARHIQVVDLHPITL